MSAGAWLLRKKKKKLTAGGPIPWIEMDGASVEVSASDDTFVELQALIDTVVSGVVVAPTNGLNQGRILHDKPFNDIWCVEALVAGGPWEMTTEGVSLEHEVGTDWSQIVTTEIAAAQAYVTGLVGTAPTYFAYPSNNHSYETMDAVKQAGFLMARTGVTGFLPASGGVVTNDFTNDPDCARTWAKWAPWSMVNQVGIDEATLEAFANKQAMEDYLYNVGGAGDAAIRHGYGSLMDAWKGLHTWVNFYCHNTASLSATKLGWLMEIVAADTDIWCERISTIGAYALARHEANGAAENSDWIYEPTAGNEAADDVGTPWNGHEAAFTFNTDDGHTDNYTAYMPVAVANNVPMSVSLTVSFISDEGGPNMSRAQIHEMRDTGLFDFGVHSWNHVSVIRNHACRLQDSTQPGGYTRGVKVVDGSGVKTIQFMTRSDIELPYQSAFRWWDFHNEGLADAAPIPSVTDRINGEILLPHTASPVIDADWQGSRAGAVFNNTPGTSFISSGYYDYHSNTNGMMIFVVAERVSSTFRPFLAKYPGATGRAFVMRGLERMGVCELETTTIDAGNQIPSCAAHLAMGVPGIICLYWEPGSTAKAYINGTLRGEQEAPAGTPAPVTSIFEESGSDGLFELGGWINGNLGFSGTIGEVLIVRSASSTLRSSYEDWLNTRWTLGL